MKIGKRMGLLLIVVLLMVFMAGCVDPDDVCKDSLAPSECEEENKLQIGIYKTINNIFLFFKLVVFGSIYLLFDKLFGWLF